MDKKADGKTESMVEFVRRHEGLITGSGSIGVHSMHILSQQLDALELITWETYATDKTNTRRDRIKCAADSLKTLIDAHLPDGEQKEGLVREMNCRLENVLESSSVKEHYETETWFETMLKFPWKREDRAIPDISQVFARWIFYMEGYIPTYIASV